MNRQITIESVDGGYIAVVGDTRVCRSSLWELYQVLELYYEPPITKTKSHTVSEWTDENGNLVKDTVEITENDSV